METGEQPAPLRSEHGAEGDEFTPGGEETCRLGKKRAILLTGGTGPLKEPELTRQVAQRESRRTSLLSSQGRLCPGRALRTEDH